MSRIDDLLNTPYWIIDILPMQVPKDSPGNMSGNRKIHHDEVFKNIKKDIPAEWE